MEFLEYVFTVKIHTPAWRTARLPRCISIAGLMNLANAGSSPGVCRYCAELRRLLQQPRSQGP